MVGTFERLVLTSICKATNISKSAHVPKSYFMKKLIARGYVRQHPTRGEMTYELTNTGLDLCREIFNKK
jgi:predicted transcriptional regulator